MSRLATRSWASLFLGSALALSACSTSTASEIRTRNSALIDSCITATPSNTEPVVIVSISDPTCAVSLVDVSERLYSPDREGPANNRRVTQRTITHNGDPYSASFEARDSDNNPVEHVTVSGLGNDPSSLTLRTSTVTQVASNDVCLVPSDNPWGVRTFDCQADDKFLISFEYNDFSYTRLIDRISYGFTYNPARHLGDSTFTVLAVRNGTPYARMTSTLSEPGVFVHKFFSYSQPTQSTPFESQSLVTESTTPTDTTTPTESTTTVETTTSTTPTDTTTPTESTSPLLDVAAISQTVQDACGSLDGIEVFPDVSTWTDSTPIELSVSNDCMTQSVVGGVEIYTVYHNLVAIHQDSGQEIYLSSSGDPRSKTLFQGRLFAGKWNLYLTQWIWLNINPDNLETIYTVREIEVDIKIDPQNGWKWCTNNDIQFDGRQLTLDCDYSNASVVLHTEANPFIELNGRATPTDISVTSQGWMPATVIINSYNTMSFFLIFTCVTGCDSLPAEVPVDIARVASGVAITPTSARCPMNQYPFIGVLHLKKSGNNLIIQEALNFQSSVDAIVTPGITAILPFRPEATHVLVYQERDMRKSDCGPQALDFIYLSIVEIPVDESSEPAEAVAASLPSRVPLVEFSREDSQGSPIVVDNSQSIIEIPTNALTASATGATVRSISVRSTDGTWTPVSTALSTFVPINDDTASLQVKYAFDDGTESVITKPIISANDYQKAIDAGSSSSSNPVMVIVIVLAMLAIVGGGFTFVRRRKA